MRKTHLSPRILALVLALMVSVGSIVSGTIAWFTSEVESKANIIKSGTLTAALSYSNDNTTWYDVEDKATQPMFNHSNWEPGYAERKALEISNTGSLAFDYTLKIIPTGEIGKLAEVIDVYVSNAWFDSRDKLVNPIGTLKEAAEGKAVYTSAAPLEGKTSAKLYFALKMRESANNDYQGLALDAFDIQLTATQAAFEHDSFGNTYDEAAPYGEKIADGLFFDGDSTYFVVNADGLKAVADEVNKVQAYTPNLFEGKTIKLECDIDLGGAEWTPIGDDRFSRTQFTGIFDGQGHTVSNFKVTKHAVDDENKSSYGLFGNVNGTIKNLTVKSADVYVENGKFSAALVGRMNGGLLENCHVLDSSVKIDNWTVGGLVAQMNAGDIKGCSVENTTITGYAAVGAIAGIRLGSGETTIENCAVKDCTLVQNGRFGGNYDEMFGAILGAVSSEEAAITRINDCTVENTTIKGGKSSTLCGYAADGNLLIIDGLINYDSEIVGGLYEFLPTLKAGDTLVLPEKTYETSGTFTIPHGVTIKGADGAKVVIRQNSAAQDNIFNCEGDATISNITFESNRKGYAINGSLKDHNGDGDLTIINCHFKGIADEKNYGVYKNLNGNLTLKDCTFDNYNNAVCGVNNANGTTTVITGCTFTNINGEAIGYVSSSVPADFEAEAIKNNTGLTADNVIGY